MSQWFVAEGRKKVGPMSFEEVAARIQKGEAGPDTLVFTRELGQWTRASQVPQLAGPLAKAPDPSELPEVPRDSHEVDFELFGSEMQFVEVELDPGESAIAEAGAMMYMDSGIEMETIFADGSAESESSGFFGKIVGAGKRLVTGESLFMTVFTNSWDGKKRVAFAAPYPGRMLALDLKRYDRELICQKDAFLAGAKGVSIGIAFQKRLGAGFFGGEGFIMQRLTGDGLVFLHAGGTLRERELGMGETLKVDTGCLVALSSSVNYDIGYVGGVKTALFGGEGLFFATLSGPGHVWLQSMPFSRLADRIYSAMPKTSGSQSKGEGSVLGALGDLIDGD